LTKRSGLEPGAEGQLGLVRSPLHPRETPPSARAVEPFWVTIIPNGRGGLAPQRGRGPDWFRRPPARPTTQRWQHVSWRWCSCAIIGPATCPRHRLTRPGCPGAPG